MENTLQHSINFYEDQVDFVSILDNGYYQTYIVIRRICENLGLAWQPQQRKLQEHHRFQKGIVMISIRSSDGSRREALCLHRPKFFLWLYSINPDKVSPEVRSKLVKYQDEVEEAIDRYFTKGGNLPYVTEERKERQDSYLIPELVRQVTIQVQHELAQILTDQKQFQQYALRGFDRIEAVLSDSLPHNMFEGYRKIKALVEDMTRMYDLSEVEIKRYTRVLCQAHDVPLPEKALIDPKSQFHDAQELAIKVGVYSTTNKPHSRLILALIRYLDLDQDRYRQQTPLIHPTRCKYSDTVIPHIVEWLQKQGDPETVEIIEGGRTRRFRVRYRT